MFRKERLSLARKRRRLTGKSLAEKADLSAVTVSRLEKGENQPDDNTIQRIANALSYPVSFFFEEGAEALTTDAISFRSLTKMSAGERDAALSASTLGLELNHWVEEQFTLPNSNLIDLSHETDPETAARVLRQHWNLGERPVGNLIGLLEQNGVRVFSLAENTASVDAFSFWRDETPFVFLNNYKTAERSIFDAGHELGHLVLHRHAGVQSSKSAERDANRFASAFLMPSDDVRARIPKVISVAIIIKAKKRWRVSAMAMAYRLRTLGLLSEWQYKSACIELGKRGYRTGEPDGIDRESSSLWRKIFAQLWTERISKNEIASQLHLPLDELEGLLWGLTMTPTNPDLGDADRPGLSIVK